MERTIAPTDLLDLIARGAPIDLLDVRRTEDRAKDPVALWSKGLPAVCRP